jgi:hypothetical protein
MIRIHLNLTLLMNGHNLYDLNSMKKKRIIDGLISKKIENRSDFFEMVVLIIYLHMFEI